MGREEADGAQALWLLRCGECETWRAFDLAQRPARRLQRRLRQALRRDRRRMKGELRALTQAEHDRTVAEA